jgi:hypothetical protein
MSSIGIVRSKIKETAVPPVNKIAEKIKPCSTTLFFLIILYQGVPSGGGGGVGHPGPKSPSDVTGG